MYSPEIEAEKARALKDIALELKKRNDIERLYYYCSLNVINGSGVGYCPGKDFRERVTKVLDEYCYDYKWKDKEKKDESNN